MNSGKVWVWAASVQPGASNEAMASDLLSAASL